MGKKEHWSPMGMNWGDLGDTFDSFFGTTTKVMKSTESFKVKDGKIIVELELAGVDPGTVSVKRSLSSLRVEWTGRDGKNEVKQYDVQAGEVINGAPVAELSHGLLTVTLTTTTADKADGWSTVIVTRK